MEFGSNIKLSRLEAIVKKFNCVATEVSKGRYRVEGENLGWCAIAIFKSEAIWE